MVGNKGTIFRYKIFLFIPFILFILISAFSIFYINIPSVDDVFMSRNSKAILEGREISTNFYGLFLTPLLFYWLFGISTFTLRISQVFFLFLALLLFSKLRLSPKKKIIGLFLIATSPFIIPGRNEVNFLPFFVLLPFILLDGKKIEPKRIFLSSLILGFGSTVKLTVLYFAIPFLIFFAISKRFKKKEILLLVIGFILGFSAFIIVEATSNFPTFRYCIDVILSGKAWTGYEIYNFQNLTLVFSTFLDSLNLIPYDLNPSSEFFKLPLVSLSQLLIPIYFLLFLLSIFVLVKRKQRLELIFTILIFIFLLQFNPSVPKTCHFYFLLPFIIFLILESMNEKYIPLLIFPLICGSLLSYEIIKNLPNEKLFPSFGSHKHNFFTFLLTSGFNNDNTSIVTSLSELEAFQTFLNVKEITSPIEYSFKYGTINNRERLENIYSFIKRNETLIFVFPSHERKTLEERSIYDDCYSINNTDYSINYPCYDGIEIIKDIIKDVGELKLIKIINDSNGVPVYEIFLLIYK
jgi:hypothetical protein